MPPSKSQRDRFAKEARDDELTDPIRKVLGAPPPVPVGTGGYAYVL